MNHVENIIEKFKNYKLLEDDKVIVDLNITKVNNSWKGSVFYIPTVYKNIYNKEKYNHIKNNILNSNVYIPPHIEFVDNLVKFVEGRYTFSVIRDIGCTSMPFIVYLDDLEIVSELFV
jgi:hypothetical protein